MLCGSAKKEGQWLAVCRLCVGGGGASRSYIPVALKLSWLFIAKT